MLLELSVVPLGRGRSISADVAGVVKIIDASGLDYRLTAAGTILEGTWDEVMAVAKKCHREMRKKTERVITYMKLDDYGERAGRLTAALESVEKKLGKSVKKEQLRVRGANFRAHQRGGTMARWTGETITLQIGAKWTYKLQLREEAEAGGRSDVVLGHATFNSEQEARAAGDAHLKTEIEKRSS